MDTIKLANEVLTKGISLLPDEAKAEYKAQLGDIFTNEAISNACGMVNGDPEKEALLAAWAVQEANRVVTTLWREGLLPSELEEKYRKLPSLKLMADQYNDFTAARKSRMDKLTEQHKAIAEEEKELDIFKGVINGMSKAESEQKYKQFEHQQQQALAGGR